MRWIFGVIALVFLIEASVGLPLFFHDRNDVSAPYSQRGPSVGGRNIKRAYSTDSNSKAKPADKSVLFRSMDDLDSGRNPYEVIYAARANRRAASFSDNPQGKAGGNQQENRQSRLDDASPPYQMPRLYKRERVIKPGRMAPPQSYYTRPVRFIESEWGVKPARVSTPEHPPNVEGGEGRFANKRSFKSPQTFQYSPYTFQHSQNFK